MQRKRVNKSKCVLVVKQISCYRIMELRIMTCWVVDNKDSCVLCVLIIASDMNIAVTPKIRCVRQYQKFTLIHKMTWMSTFRLQMLTCYLKPTQAGQTWAKLRRVIKNGNFRYGCLSTGVSMQACVISLISALKLLCEIIIECICKCAPSGVYLWLCYNAGSIHT